MQTTSSPTPPGADPASALADYAGRGPSFDEVLEPGGAVRPHWRQFARGLHHLGLDEFRGRWQDARQLLRQNGVTYNVYGDPRGLARPWPLDPVPLVISAAEGDALEAGL